jgi:hypothetical protein
MKSFNFKVTVSRDPEENASTFCGDHSLKLQNGKQGSLLLVTWKRTFSGVGKSNIYIFKTQEIMHTPPLRVLYLTPIK